MSNKTKKKRKLSSQELVSFCDQLSIILKSGGTLIEGIDIMYQNSQSNGEKEILSTINNSLEMNASFKTSLDNTKVFPSYFIKMINIGEKTGKLDEVVEGLYQYYESETNIKSRVKDALTGPFILMLMIAGVILIITYKVIPIFDEVFASLGMNTSATTTIIMKHGILIGNLSLIMVIIGIIIELFIFITIRTNSQDIYMKIPLLKGIYKKIALQRFTSSMYLILSSGMMVDNAFEMTSDIIKSKELKQKSTICLNLIKDGVSLPNAIIKSKIFSGMLQNLASMGGEAGQFDKVMLKISKVYENEVDEKINKIILNIEFMMVAFLCFIVGMILMSVILPLLGVMATL